MDRSRLKVLALDDEPFALRVVEHLMRRLGYTGIATCDNGRAALRRVDDPATRPDVILLDLNMPEMDGAEFVRELVDHGYEGSLVLVSGEEERVMRMAQRLVEAHRIRVLGRLGKPFTLEALDSVMEQSAVAHAAHAARPAPFTRDELHAAIAGNQFINHYQPKVAVATGAVVGAEALVRWLHPEQGLVPPDAFIPLAEDCGLIDPLTHVVARNALRQARMWQDAGIRLKVAINISMENLTSIAFTEFLDEAANASGMAPKDVVLEVTESRLILDQRAPLEILTRLRMKRFPLSIDDFGTGHSSLKLLRDVPFDELKIDRNFVQDARWDPTARAIYDASLALGRRLGMHVVAEGVETQDEWDLVRRTGCDLAQGYFIARPMPAEELPAWIEAWTAAAGRQRKQP